MTKDSRINVYIDKLLYDSNGQMFVSAIFGLALALMFNRVCKDNCILFYAPRLDDIQGKKFKLEDTCHSYSPYTVQCDKKQKIIKPYDINVHPDNVIEEKGFISRIMNN